MEAPLGALTALQPDGGAAAGPYWLRGARDVLSLAAVGPGLARLARERLPRKRGAETRARDRRDSPDRDGRLENLGRISVAERVQAGGQHGAGRGRRLRSGGARRRAGEEHGGGRGPERGASVPAGARAATRKARSGSHGMGSPPRSPPPP